MPVAYSEVYILYQHVLAIDPFSETTYKWLDYGWIQMGMWVIKISQQIQFCNQEYI